MKEEETLITTKVRKRLQIIKKIGTPPLHIYDLSTPETNRHTPKTLDKTAHSRCRTNIAIIRLSSYAEHKFM